MLYLEYISKLRDKLKPLIRSFQKDQFHQLVNFKELVPEFIPCIGEKDFLNQSLEPKDESLTKGAFLRINKRHFCTVHH